jgi:peptide/nickel transport system substrate-binding protein
MKSKTAIRALITLAAAGALALSGCSAPSASGGGNDAAGADKPFTMRTASSPTFQANFNPFAATANQGTTKGLFYEPLVLFTPWNPGVGTPWLASSYEFNDDGTELTFQVREGVKWSDGKDMTPADVAYSFNVLKDNPATNLAAIPVESATVDGRSVVLKLTQPSFALMPQIGNTVVVPEHVFSKQSDVSAFQNEKPVATGPYTLKSFTPQRYTLEKNAGYWSKDGYEVPEINVVTEDSATFINNLVQGNIDWAGGFLEKVDDVYINKDKENNQYWFPGAGIVYLAVNNQSQEFSDLTLKKAISLAIDREKISDLAFAGYAQAPNETGLVLPVYKEFLADDKKDALLKTNVDEANSMLDKAGYTKDSDGMRSTPKGEPLKMTLNVPANFADWITVTQLLDEQLAEIGVDLDPQGVAETAWGESNRSGDYDIAMASAPIYASPFFFYRNALASDLSAPAGEPAKTNISRWEDPETEKILKDFAASSDEASQLESIQALGDIVADEMPFIPMVVSPTWGLYRTANWTGFPSEEDPYAAPTPYTYPDNLLVLQNLKPASGS